MAGNRLLIKVNMSVSWDFLPDLDSWPYCGPHLVLVP